jgi:hypothetical protein
MYAKVSIAAAAVMLLGALAPMASAQDCLGLECSGALPPSSVGRGALQSVSSPQELETKKVSGFYEFGLNNPEYRARAVAYVATPGTLQAAPPEILALPSAQAVSEADSKIDTIVIYGPGVATIAGGTARADAARSRAQKGAKARVAQNPGTCPNGWFCLFDYDDYVGDRGIWQDTGIWQDLAPFGWNDRAESMQNKRSGATLLATGTGGGGSRYCAQAGTADADLSNNGSISNNGSSLYNSTAAAYHSSWNCFNPY